MEVQGIKLSTPDGSVGGTAQPAHQDPVDHRADGRPGGQPADRRLHGADARGPAGRAGLARPGGQHPAGHQPGRPHRGQLPGEPAAGRGRHAAGRVRRWPTSSCATPRARCWPLAAEEAYAGAEKVLPPSRSRPWSASWWWAADQVLETVHAHLLRPAPRIRASPGGRQAAQVGTVQVGIQLDSLDLCRSPTACWRGVGIGLRRAGCSA